MTFEQWLQSWLTAHGYPVGVIDGVIGPKTRAALRAFQAARGLQVTGSADALTVDALRLSSTAGTTAPEDRDKHPLASPAPHGSWPRQDGVPAFYGKVGTSQVMLDLPYPMVLAWDKRRTVRRISLHSKVAASAGEALQEIAGIYNASERRALGVDIFGGSLNVRKMRGGSRYSMHSWGIAIDFDPERNQLHWRAPKPRLSHDDAVPFWQAWEKRGWLSLGRARDMDYMHVQAARL